MNNRLIGYARVSTDDQTTRLESVVRAAALGGNPKAAAAMHRLGIPLEEPV